MLRKSREDLDKTKFDILKPIDVLTLGSDNDPCFGKHHDLKAPECMECGDAELCAVMKAQNLRKERINIETNQRFKDIEESEYEMTQLKRQIKNLVSKYKSQGKPRLKTILIISRKLSVSKDIVKNIYDETK